MKRNFGWIPDVPDFRDFLCRVGAPRVFPAEYIPNPNLTCDLWKVTLVQELLAA